MQLISLYNMRLRRQYLLSFAQTRDCYKAKAARLFYYNYNKMLTCRLIDYDSTIEDIAVFIEISYNVVYKERIK